MYAEFYGLRNEPFPVTPEASNLYLSDTHKEALAALFHGVERRRGFVQIVGEVGTGKTTIMRAFLNALDATRYTTVVVVDPNMSFAALLQYMTQELGEASQTEGYALVSEVQGRLIEEYRAGRNVVLLIDEAHNMPVRTLELLRMLSNIETEEKKLIQIVLVGQPELDDALACQELRQLRQRIGIRAVIVPLPDKDAHAYLEQHVTGAGGDLESVLTRGAREEIVGFAAGVPRLLNIGADTTLTHGLGAGQRPATRAIARDALASLRPRSPGVAGRHRFAAAAAITVMLGAALAWYLTAYAPTPPNTAVAGTPPVVEAPQLARRVEAPSTTAAADGQAAHSTRVIAAPLALDPVMLSRPAVVEVTSGAPAISPPVARARSATRPVGDASELAALQRGRIKWDREPLPDDFYPVVHEVQRGDLISQLCFDIYGFAADELYEFLALANPALASVDALEPGQRITFPPLSPSLQALRRAHIDYKIRIANAARREDQ